MTIHPRYLGCDVSKDFLDIYDPNTAGVDRIANTPDAISTYLDSLHDDNVIVVLEATGAYDRVLRETLAKAGLCYARVNPTKARRYAQVAGFLAKTDAVDARMLHHMGTTFGLSADPHSDPHRQTLTALHKRRDQLVQMCADEKKRRHITDNDDLQASLQDHIVWLQNEIADIDGKIRELIKATDELRQDVQRLTSAPGVGAVTSTTILALLPELGRLSPKKIASLVGIAPVNNDSGMMRGKRRIKGGRARVRKALYMAALGAIKKDPRFAEFYNRIVERSGIKKVAIIAVARKLLIVLNAMLRDKVHYT